MFDPVKGFKLEDYYGVALMSVKKNDNFQIRLQYDYDKKATNSNPVELDNINDAILMYEVLTKYRKQRTAAKRMKLNLVDPEEKIEPEIEVTTSVALKF